MNTVVEIGCGNKPGPRFPEAKNYYALDPDLQALKQVDPAAGFVTVAVSATDLPFYSRSVDTIIARNVFGDPLLCSPDQRRRKDDMRFFLQAGKFEEYLDIDNELRHKAVGVKSAIIHEAGRTLIKSSNLVVVENLTPWVTEEYLNGPGKMAAEEAGLAIHPVDLTEVLPAKYAQHYKDVAAPLAAWALTKD